MCSSGGSGSDRPSRLVHQPLVPSSYQRMQTSRYPSYMLHASEVRDGSGRSCRHAAGRGRFPVRTWTVECTPRPYWIATTRRCGFVPPNVPGHRLIGLPKRAKCASCIHGVIVEALNQGLVWIVGFGDARSDRTPEAQRKQVNITASPLRSSLGTAP